MNKQDVLNYASEEKTENAVYQNACPGLCPHYTDGSA